MDQDLQQGDDTSVHVKPSSYGRRSSSGIGKRAAVTPPTPSTTTTTAPPCGACKFLRRKCISGCIFAPYFGSDQGAARFAAVHKVFGASNVSKLLLRVLPNRRHDAVLTISYEAQARLSDPVYGCVSTILALQQQVASLQAELSAVHNQLMSSRLAMVNALQSIQQHQQNQPLHQPPNFAVLQPAYSNNSSVSNNLVNLSSLSSNFDIAVETTAPSSRSFDPLQLSRLSQEEEDEEDETHNPAALANQILHQK
ncbi:LOB domain-containing protein 20 [Telopea speciosissima]|uniref:LOB domain-containing protein 20 n=1 Tax=Telopea speciosissima TaxID=54955 RepID=UPI001CC411BF|nr:LOB domain-containing protein 20 [Telopea speciosissima]